MFEFSIAKGYLWPKKKQLSVSLIGLLSVFVISLVIWLVLLFLSVTEGIEKNWLTKLTSLNAPIRLNPTEEYYRSYYYQVDSIASSSDFAYKTIQEKRFAAYTDPYNPEVDEEIPFYWPVKEATEDGNPIDLVKSAFTAIEHVGARHSEVQAGAYDTCGALMRLRLIRKDPFSGRHFDEQSFLTQGTYIASFSKDARPVHSLIQPPTVADINHLIYLSDQTGDLSEVEDRPFLGYAKKEVRKYSALQSIFTNIKIRSLTAKGGLFQLDQALLPKQASFVAFGRIAGGRPHFLVLPLEKNGTAHEGLTAGIIGSTPDGWTFSTKDGISYPLEESTALLIEQDWILLSSTSLVTLEDSATLRDLRIPVSGTLQGKLIQGDVSWDGLEIREATIQDHFLTPPEITPPWVHFVNGIAVLPEHGAILPRNYRDSHALIGDRGFFSYGATTPTSFQEQRIPMIVSGFYDPGVMAVGARFILSDESLVHQINTVSESISLDPTMGTGIQVWIGDLKETQAVAKDLRQELVSLGIAPYWEVTTFYEYEFAKDLLSQFQSDRYLFMLVGILVLFVACCNIISLLLVLVNDKKHEIGILLSLGAKKRHIALIFGLCGISLGVVACLIGLFAAFATLHNIESLVQLLNALEGREAFNSAFYGSSLPSDLSKSATLFVLIVTPLLTLLSGLVPAIRACRFKPSAILRSE